MQELQDMQIDRKVFTWSEMQKLQDDLITHMVLACITNAEAARWPNNQTVLAWSEKQKLKDEQIDQRCCWHDQRCGSWKMSILTKGSGMIRKSGRCSKMSKLTKDFGMIIKSRSCKIMSKLSFCIYISITITWAENPIFKHAQSAILRDENCSQWMNAARESISYFSVFKKHWQHQLWFQLLEWTNHRERHTCMTDSSRKPKHRAWFQWCSQ